MVAAPTTMANFPASGKRFPASVLLLPAGTTVVIPSLKSWETAEKVAEEKAESEGNKATERRLVVLALSTTQLIPEMLFLMRKSFQGTNFL